MKKLLIAMCILLATAFSVEAMGLMMVGGGVSAEPPADGPNVYYYPGTKTSSSFGSEDGYNVMNDYYTGAIITVGQAGSCTILSAKVKNASVSATTIKLYLLSSADAILASCSVALAGEFPTGWKDCTLGTPYSVTATNYKVLVGGASGDATGYNDTDGNGVYSETNYPSDPTSLTTDTGFLHGVRMYVD